MSYPSVITSFPQPTASSRLNNPSHSALENLQSSTIGQMQAVIGLSGDSSVLGTIIGDLRSPDSNGGGHVQTANTGGTGQTNYSKGQLLVASSSSVLSKLAAGADNTVLLADSSQATGVRWSNVVANKVTVRTSVASYTVGASSVANVLFVASIAGSVIGSNNAVRFTGTIDSFFIDANNTNTIDVQYGQKSVMSIAISANAPATSVSGTITGMIMGNGAVNDQKAFMTLNLGNNVPYVASIISVYRAGASSVNSSANQDLFITTKTNWNAGGATASIQGTMFVVEKIL